MTECPLRPENEPRRPVRYAFCSVCEQVVKSGRLCPIREEIENEWWDAIR